MTDLLDRPLRDTWRLWLALVAAPALWGARLLAGWTVAEVACARGWAGTPTYLITQTAIALVALALTAVSGWAAWTAIGSHEEVGFDPGDSERFLAVTGIITAALFGLLIALESTSVYLVACG